MSDFTVDDLDALLASLNGGKPRTVDAARNALQAKQPAQTNPAPKAGPPPPPGTLPPPGPPPPPGAKGAPPPPPGAKGASPTATAKPGESSPEIFGIPQAEKKISDIIGRPTPIVLELVMNMPTDWSYKGTVAAVQDVLLNKLPDSIKELSDRIGTAKVQAKFDRIIVKTGNSFNGVQLAFSKPTRALVVEICYSTLEKAMSYDKVEYKKWAKQIDDACPIANIYTKPVPADKLIPLHGTKEDSSALLEKLRKLVGNPNLQCYFDVSCFEHKEFPHDNSDPIPELMWDFSRDDQWLNGLIFCCENYPGFPEKVKKINKIIYKMDMDLTVRLRSDPVYWNMFIFGSGKPDTIHFEVDFNRAVRQNLDKDKVDQYLAYFDVPAYNQRVREKDAAYAEAKARAGPAWHDAYY